MKYRVVEYYSHIGRTLWFRVECKQSWISYWDVEHSFGTLEAVDFIETKQYKERVVYVSK